MANAWGTETPEQVRAELAHRTNQLRECREGTAEHRLIAMRIGELTLRLQALLDEYEHGTSEIYQFPQLTGRCS